MRHIKLFENENELKVGDYVICVDKTEDNELFDIYLSKHIGKIVKFSGCFIYIKFKDFPKKFGNTEISDPVNFQKEEIIYHSENKEDCELYLVLKKYNL